MMVKELKGPDAEIQYQNLIFHKRGGMGEIYVADDIIHTRKVAVKIIPVSDPEDYKLLKSESSISKSIVHENIVETYHTDEYSEGGVTYFYFVMEMVEEGNLRGVLTADSENILLPKVLEMMIQISKGLEEAHKTIIHRDLKPENILGNENLRICDFGLAKLIDSRTRSRTFKGSGTLPYMAPECWTFDHNSESMDIYSLGIIFFELLTKRLPFDGSNEKELKDQHLFQQLPDICSFRSDVPVKLTELISKMTNKRSSDRYSAMSEVLRILESFEVDNTDQDQSLEELASMASQKTSQKIQSDLEQQKLVEQELEMRKFLEYSEDQVINQFIDRIDLINNNLETDKIRYIKNPGLTVRFHENELNIMFFPSSDIEQFNESQIERGKQFQLQQHGMIFSQPESTNIHNDNVQLVGKVNIPTGDYYSPGFGFNLILRKIDEHDLYGEWWITWFDDSPLVRGPVNKFYPLDIPEFYTEYEIGRGRSMHTRSMEFKKMEPSDVDKLIRKLLE